MNSIEKTRSLIQQIADLKKATAVITKKRQEANDERGRLESMGDLESKGTLQRISELTALEASLGQRLALAEAEVRAKQSDLAGFVNTELLTMVRLSLNETAERVTAKTRKALEPFFVWPHFDDAVQSAEPVKKAKQLFNLCHSNLHGGDPEVFANKLIGDLDRAAELEKSLS